MQAGATARLEPSRNKRGLPVFLGLPRGSGPDDGSALLWANPPELGDLIEAGVGAGDQVAAGLEGMGRMEGVTGSEAWFGHQ